MPLTMLPRVSFFPPYGYPRAVAEWCDLVQAPSA
jgi:hypothetical protein